MKRFSLALVLCMLVFLGGLPASSHAVASLQVAPLKYQATLRAGSPQAGTITVSNPTDSTIQVQSQVQAIRQTGSGGDLQYYDDPTILAGIRISNDVVPIAPHASVNFRFQLNSDSLPQRGVYAVIFFRTVPGGSGKTTYIKQAVRVGTLLLLNNGLSAQQRGKVTSLQLPAFAWGSQLAGTVTYHNSGQTAFNPHLQLHVGYGSAQVLDGPYILPGAQRSFTFTLHGSYVGWVRVHVADTASGQTTGRNLWAITGYWRWLLPLLIGLLAAGGYGVVVWRHGKPTTWRRHS